MTDAPPAAVPATTPIAGSETVGAARPRGVDAAFAGAISAIWLRELRGRMRGKRAFIFVTVYLAFLVGILWTIVRGAIESPDFGALQQVSVGRGIFTGIIMIETLVVVALAPAYTAGSISAEREKQTFDLLAVTPVSSLAIVLGKLLSGLSYLVLIVALSIPLASMALLFGGIGVETVVIAYLLIFVTAVGVGSIGIACSALMRRTQPATVGSLMIVGLVILVATMTWTMLNDQAQFEEGRQPPPEALLYLNPFFAQADLLCQSTSFACIPGLTTPEQAAQFGPVRPLDGGGAIQQPAPAPEGPVPGSLWPKSAISWVLVSAALIALASQAISPTRGWRPNRTRTATTEPET